MGAEHDVDPRGLLEDDVLVLLGEAAADGDLHSFALALRRREVAKGSVELVVGVLAHRAGVDDDDVRGGAVGAHVAGGFERAAQPLGVVHVHLAAEGAHLVGADRRGRVAGLRIKKSHDGPSLRRALGVAAQRKRTELAERSGSACATAARTVPPS